MLAVGRFIRLQCSDLRMRIQFENLPSCDRYVSSSLYPLIHFRPMSWWNLTMNALTSWFLSPLKAISVLQSQCLLTFVLVQVACNLWGFICCKSWGWAWGGRGPLRDTSQHLSISSYAARVHKAWLDQQQLNSVNPTLIPFTPIEGKFWAWICSLCA